MAIPKKDWKRIKAFGANVRRERVRKALTQEELAERAEIATRNLQKLRLGKSTSALRRRLEFNWGFVARGSG